jgi:hypothetical protein
MRLKSKFRKPNAFQGRHIVALCPDREVSLFEPADGLSNDRLDAVSFELPRIIHFSPHQVD